MSLDDRELNGTVTDAAVVGAYSAAPSPRQFDDGQEFSLDEAILYLGTGRFQVRLLFLVGAFMISISLQFQLLAYLAFIVQCEMPEWHVTDRTAALLSTLVFLGMLFGTLAWGTLSDLYGRKPIMLAVAATSTFFSALRAVAHSYESLLALQFFLGASLSGFGVAFTYFVEFFPSSNRAKWSMMLTLFWTLGMILGTLLSWATETLGFRVLCIVCTFPSLVNVIAMIKLPRSPHFLVSKSRITEARDVLAAAAVFNRKPFPPGFVLVDRSAKTVTARTPIVASLGPRYRRTTLLLYFIWFTLGFIYYGAMMMSSSLEEARVLMRTELNSSIAFNSSLPVTNTSLVFLDDTFCPRDGSRVFSDSDYADSLIIATAEIPGIAVSWMFVDRAGRRATQTGACLLFAIAIFILGVLPPNAPGADIFFLFIARGISNTGETVTWIYTPEVYPSSFRTTAFAVSECFSHIGAMITPFVGQTMLADGYLPEACMIYFCAALLCALASFSLKVETAGKELGADDDDILRQSSSSRLDFASSSPIRPDTNGIEVTTEHGRMEMS